MFGWEAKVLLVAATRESILREVNKASEFFRRTMKEEGVSLDRERWKIGAYKTTSRFLISFSTPAPSELIDKAEKLDTFKSTHCNGIFSANSYVANPFINYTLKCRDLLNDIIVGKNKQLMDELAVAIFKHEVSPEEFQKLFVKRAKIIPYFDELLRAVQGWMLEVTFKTSTEYGRSLYKATQYFPELRKSPSNTLYRCIAVANSLFEKAETGKAIILKHRTYSSWTYDLRAAKSFGKHKANDINTKKYTLILIRKNFTDENIACNIEAASAYLQKYGAFKTSLTKKEKEIVVRNPNNNFIFKPSDIYLYAKISKKTVGWRPF